MATAPKTAPKDDTANYYLGLVLFSVLVPALFFVSVYLSPRGESTRPHAASAEGAAEAASAEGAAEAAPAAAPAE